ncbi:hypothetical protein [Dyella japonica]|jgi:hypothetical protein|uniref:Uncharacterized protein n=1 Tax=Dyella japonica DSM 16301 TaxID=1440762 RepID=A0A0G9GZ39_9GAMM|nr:hypothetical protein [Dyella japonica]KLD62830.1 hypothetical protein Y882_14250 [Dyella japonica DSM 16301]
MRWPWRDLLFLHGHIVEPSLTSADVAEESSANEKEKPPAPSFSRRSLAALRLCLGIGDGAIRTQ